MVSPKIVKETTHLKMQGIIDIFRHRQPKLNLCCRLRIVKVVSESNLFVLNARNSNCSSIKLTFPHALLYSLLFV